MADKYARDDDEEDVLAPKEPQVTSDKPEERKAARALRIKKRQEALKKLEQQQAEDDAVIIPDEEPGLIEKATAEAAEELQRLILEGNEKVTNVKVTADDREVTRRFKVMDMNKEYTQKLEEDAEEAQLKYDIISSKWENIMELTDPLDIEAELQEQKIKCNLLMDQKNVLIDELKNELMKIDEAYVEDMEKQDMDIREMSDRIQRQMTIIQRAYDKALFLIETAISAERSSMVEYNQKRWEALYRQRDREELGHMDLKFEQREDFANEMDNIFWSHIELYRGAKMELETLIQELQKELEKLKAVCLINGEKIGYNYQVLKKREEENVFVRSQQKRKLNKMSDVMNTLRTKIRKAAEDGAIEEAKGDIEIAKMKQAMLDLENKSTHFAQVSDYKLQQVWRMNLAHCTNLLHQLRQCELVLHAHVLAEPPPCNMPCLPPNPLSAVAASMSEKKESANRVEVTDENNTAAIDAKQNLVRHILSLVADNTGFLVENRLHELLEPYTKTDKSLCSLDAIFTALEIHREEDIELLCETFLAYAFCPVCVALEDFSDEDEVSTERLNAVSKTSWAEKGSHSAESKDSLRARGFHAGEKSIDRMSSMGAQMRGIEGARTSSPSTSHSTHTHITFKYADSKLPEQDQKLMTEAGIILQNYQGPIGGEPSKSSGVHETESTAGGRRARGVTVTSLAPEQVPVYLSRNPFLCPVGHTLEIEPMQVLTALSDFINVFTPPEKQKLNEILESVKPRDMKTPSRILLPSEIEEYWGKIRDIFPDTKEKLWSNMAEGLAAYLHMLQERVKLHEEVEGLRARNRQLRSLMRGRGLPALARGAGRRPRAIPDYLLSQPDKFTATFELPRI